jgi:hypothetical protein
LFQSPIVRPSSISRSFVYESEELLQRDLADDGYLRANAFAIAIDDLPRCLDLAVAASGQIGVVTADILRVFAEMETVLAERDLSFAFIGFPDLILESSASQIFVESFVAFHLFSPWS